jgi:transcriptional regulator with XRE-family HTH domain
MRQRHRHLTLREFAAELGCSEGHLCRIEKGRKRPSAGLAALIATKLGVPFAHLFEWDSDEDEAIPA